MSKEQQFVGGGIRNYFHLDGDRTEKMIEVEELAEGLEKSQEKIKRIKKRLEELKMILKEKKEFLEGSRDIEVDTLEREISLRLQTINNIKEVMESDVTEQQKLLILIDYINEEEEMWNDMTLDFINGQALTIFGHEFDRSIN